MAQRPYGLMNFGSHKPAWIFTLVILDTIKEVLSWVVSSQTGISCFILVKERPPFFFFFTSCIDCTAKQLNSLGNPDENLMSTWLYCLAHLTRIDSE